MEIGAQFYTLRDFCKDTESFSETLKRVADIGYKTIQISGTCEFSPEWLKKELKKNGLKCALTHAPTDKLKDNPKKIAKEHDIFDCKYIGLGYYAYDKESSFDDFFRFYKPVAKTLKENGKYFLYHNHDQEFKKHDGKLIIEAIAEEIPAEELGFVLDTFWIQAGGADPAQWIERFSGRVPCIHLKDYSYGQKMSVVGEGNINFDRVFEKAEAAGTEYMFVEQDDCNGENPFDCLKRSFEYLKSRGF